MAADLCVSKVMKGSTVAEHLPVDFITAPDDGRRLEKAIDKANGQLGHK